MKQNLKIVLFSCLVGTALAAFFFLHIQGKAQVQIKNNKTLFFFQIGVFKNKENAQNLKSAYEGAKIIKKEDYYRVFIGVTGKNKELMTAFFDQKNYTYYIKEIEVEEELVNTINKFDELLKKATKEDQEIIIKRMLESLPNEL